MTRQLIFFFCVLFLCYKPLQAQLPSYDITASLNDRDRTLDGFLKVEYRNHTKDTLHYLWFNIYPNAFKTDRTAFSEHLLDKGKTDFYFSNREKRGYINRLDFRSGENRLRTEDHPLYIDVTKVILDKPLAPGQVVAISTPFHVKIPYNFDGIGYDGTYHLRYWYPAVASYVKPLTNADSSSNEYATYRVQFIVGKRFQVKALSVNNPDTVIVPNNDSLKRFTFEATNVNDVPLEIYPTGYGEPKRKTESDLVFDWEKVKKILSRPILPAAGYNVYDGLQLGVLAHNLHKEDKYDYYLAPLYAFKSKSVTGIGGVSYRFNPEKYVEEVEAGITGSAFSYIDGVDTNNNKVFGKLFKVVPYIKVKLPAGTPKVEKTLVFKSYIINERDPEFVRYSVDSFFYPSEGEYVTRFVNELTFDYFKKRVLYPYGARIQLQQGLTYYRLNATGNYFFNYPKYGGMNVRVFASKFGYLGSLSTLDKFRTVPFQPKLTAVRGGEDFTYSNYFIGRNEFEGLPGQQIMMRDGGLKLRTDLFEDLQGRSDNWIASVNVNTTLPDIFPVRVPLRIFFDAGTHAEAWEDGYVNPRFLYVAGLQLSLFKEVLNIYAPVLYSKEFRDRLKSVPEENKFFKKISFSIDIQKIDLRKLL